MADARNTSKESQAMDRLDWAWSRVDILVPELYPSSFVGSVSQKPAALAACPTINASAWHQLFVGNIDHVRNSPVPEPWEVILVLWTKMAI